MANNIYIGPAGWSYPDWNGTVYPLKQDKGFDALAYIAFYFNLIEINNTFYRIPSVNTVRRWVERVSGNPDFMFTVKSYRNFTHGQEPLSDLELNTFKKAVEPVYSAGILGGILLQFPWSFRYSRDSRRRIDRLVACLAPLPAAVEVRHGGWGKPEAVSYIADTGAMLCGIDQPLVGDSLSPRTFLAQPTGAYFRLHGRNAASWFGQGTSRDERYNYLYSPEELSTWTSRAAETAAEARRVYVVMNNHFMGQAVANALELKHQLLGEKVPVPAPLVRKYPRLRSIAAEAEEPPSGASPGRIQGELFKDD